MRCKPGDLAVIIDAFNRTNIGRIVKVIALHDRKGTLTMADSPDVWLVHCAQPLTWTVGDKRYRRKSGPAPDAQLQPIRGDALDNGLGAEELTSRATGPYQRAEAEAC